MGLWLVFLVWGVDWLLGVFPVNGPGASVSPQDLAGRPVLTLIIPTRGHYVRFIRLLPPKYLKT